MRCNGQCGSSTRRLMVGGLAVAMAFGAFIWLKLRLVTDVPRTAYAEPKKTNTPDADPAGQDVPGHAAPAAGAHEPGAPGQPGQP